METIFLRSGKVRVILGTNVIDARGAITGYLGRDSASGAVTASIAGNIMTVTVLGSGGVYPGNTVTGAAIPAGVVVLQQLSGTTKGVGTYLLNNDVTYSPITFASGAITLDGSSPAEYKDSAWSTFQAVLKTTSGNGTAVVNIYGSNEVNVWSATPLGTISLTGASPQSDGFTTVAPWKYVKAILTSLSGTGAIVYVTMGI